MLRSGKGEILYFVVIKMAHVVADIDMTIERIKALPPEERDREAQWFWVKNYEEFMKDMEEMKAKGMKYIPCWSCTHRNPDWSCWCWKLRKGKPKIDYLKIHDNGYVAGYTTNTKFFEFYKTDIAKAFETYWGSFVKSLWIALYHADDINTILLLKTRKHYVKEYIEDFILSEYLECNQQKQPPK